MARYGIMDYFNLTEEAKGTEIAKYGNMESYVLV